MMKPMKSCHFLAVWPLQPLLPLTSARLERMMADPMRLAAPAAVGCGCAAPSCPVDQVGGGAPGATRCRTTRGLMRLRSLRTLRRRAEHGANQQGNKCPNRRTVPSCQFETAASLRGSPAASGEGNKDRSPFPVAGAYSVPPGFQALITSTGGTIGPSPCSVSISLGISPAITRR